MFTKGQKVTVKPYQRLRTIFNNAEVNPGKWISKAGYDGTIEGIYDDTGELTYVVKGPYSAHHDGHSYEEHTADEMVTR